MVRDDELRQLIRERNPWWRLAALGQDPTSWTATDSLLAQTTAVGIEYEPDALIDVAPPGLWTLRGPRRVGKSVCVKRLVARLCGDPAIDPNQVIYFSSDGFRPQDLRRAFVMGRDLTAAADPRPRIWVVDEVTAVAGWVPVVKELRDNTALARDAVVLTGSSADDLDDARRGLGAGRTGVSNPFRLLLPMTFRSFLATTGVEVPFPDRLRPDALQTTPAGRAVRDLEPFCDVLDLAWQRFLECGGFPRAVGEHRRHGMVSAEFVFDLLSWLAADVEPDGPAESVPRLLAELHRRTGAPLDVRNTGVALGMSRERLRVRLTRLVSTFATMRCAQSDQHGRPMESGQSKMYLSDPLLAHLPMLRDATFDAPDMSKLTENQLAVELAVATDRLHPDRFVEQRAILYARTGGGKEVDFAPVPLHVAGRKLTTTPIEGKWVSQNWRSETLVMRGRYGAGVLATKNIVDLDGPVWAVPAPILAMLLN